jgi:hypothetical protein
LDAGADAIIVAKSAIAKPATSVNKCAASDKIAREFAHSPPVISKIIKSSESPIARLSRVSFFIAIGISESLCVGWVMCGRVAWSGEWKGKL